MENSKEHKFINISNRSFEPCLYDCSEYQGLGYKPANAFWGSLESKNSEYFSEWDEMYGREIYKGEIHITSFAYSGNAFLFNPGNYPEILIDFYRKVEREYHGYSDIEIRHLLVQVLREQQIIDNDTQYLICQIDIVEDQETIEEAFTGFKFAEENSDDVFKNFDYKVRRGIMRCFSGIEVTNYALGREEGTISDGIYECEMLKMLKEPRYGSATQGDTHLGFWDVHSVAIFDTNSIKILSQKILTSDDIQKRSISL